MAWAFNGLSVDVERREVRRGPRPVRVEPKVFDLLVYLIRHRDRVVRKDELINVIWGGRFISESALTTRINGVRRAVGDTGKEQYLIRTLRGKGFRFIGEVVDSVVTPQPSYSEESSDLRTRPLRSASMYRTSVIILPFRTLSYDFQERWFAEGLLEEVVVALSRFGSLSVLSANRYFLPSLASKHTGQHYDLRSYIVSGSVYRFEEKIRIQLQMMESNTGSIEWADRFDGALVDGFLLQGKLALTIASRIASHIQMAETMRFRSASSSNATPYELRSQAHPIFSSGRRQVLHSLALLERAIELDPDYGLALADAANGCQILDVNGWVDNRELNRRTAVKFARMCLRASDDPVPVAISAFVLAYFGENIDVSMDLLGNALTLNPAFAKGWYMSGMTQLYAGLPESAVEHFEKSIQLNPRDRITRRSRAGLGVAEFFRGQFDNAISLLRSTIEEFPLWATPYCVLASGHAHLGFLHDAEGVTRRLRKIDTVPVPGATQFRHNAHRALLLPGLRLAGIR